MASVTLLWKPCGAHDLFGTPSDAGGSPSVGTALALRNGSGVVRICFVNLFYAVPSCGLLRDGTAAAVRVDAALELPFPVQAVPAVIYVVAPRLPICFHNNTSFARIWA